MGAIPQPQDDTKNSVIPTRPIQDVPPYSTLGQLSFAPATQTTVVTTTTTTTTDFPPFVMKAPSHLHNLDPKLYPLAATPTPQSMKRFCFDLGGQPTFFREADDTGQTLQEVSPVLAVISTPVRNGEAVFELYSHVFLAKYSVLKSIVQATSGSFAVVRRCPTINRDLPIELRNSRIS